jgi:hypothetical protein
MYGTYAKYRSHRDIIKQDTFDKSSLQVELFFRSYKGVEYRTTSVLYCIDLAMFLKMVLKSTNLSCWCNKYSLF